MTITFEKYQGAGNDFILIDIRQGIPRMKEETIRFLCDRRWGIGGDGLITLEKEESTGFFMRYYNSDGKESTLCGNGGRCFAWYIHRMENKTDNIIFRAIDGTHEAQVLSCQDKEAVVRLKMPDVPAIDIHPPGYVLNTGSPHLVVFGSKVKEKDVKTEGRTIRYSEDFYAEGINVDFAEHLGKDLMVRTYERGVEDETLSCGTGVTAAALTASFLDKNMLSPVLVITRGGRLQVFFQRKQEGFSEIWLEGPANHVFTGSISI